MSEADTLSVKDLGSVSKTARVPLNSLSASEKPYMLFALEKINARPELLKGSGRAHFCAEGNTGLNSRYSIIPLYRNATCLFAEIETQR